MPRPVLRLAPVTIATLASIVSGTFYQARRAALFANLTQMRGIDELTMIGIAP